MEAIGAFTPEKARELWQDYLSRRRQNPQVRENFPVRRPAEEFRPRHIQCRLTQDLLAAVDSWTDPSTATAHVFEKYNSTNDMKWSGRTITIVNRFENISVDAGTYCKAEWIDGEWQLYAADCPASFSGSSLNQSVDPSASISTGGP